MWLMLLLPKKEIKMNFSWQFGLVKVDVDVDMMKILMWFILLLWKKEIEMNFSWQFGLAMVDVDVDMMKILLKPTFPGYPVM